MKRILCCAAVVLLSCGVNQARAAVEASGGAGPSVTTNHEGNANGFDISMDVLHDPAAGPWLKHLMNTGGGIASGLLVPITEELTNSGTDVWTDWHEQIVGPLDDNTPVGPATAFVFERDSVNVYRNGGLLTEGTDYTLQYTLHPVMQPGPNPANHAESGQHWQSVSIFFDPSSSIQPSDTLTIEKNLFETYLNGNIWNSSVVPVIAQYPTVVPEPATFAYVLVAMVVFGQRRLRRSH